jgi:hypothetical protein
MQPCKSFYKVPIVTRTNLYNNLYKISSNIIANLMKFRRLTLCVPLVAPCNHQSNNSWTESYWLYGLTAAYIYCSRCHLLEKFDSSLYLQVTTCMNSSVLATGEWSVTGELFLFVNLKETSAV